MTVRDCEASTVECATIANVLAWTQEAFVGDVVSSGQVFVMAVVTTAQKVNGDESIGTTELPSSFGQH